MGWRRTGELLRGQIATCEIAIRSKGVPQERVERAREFLKGWVDQDALYIVHTEQQVRMLEYLLEVCELLAEKEDEPTNPDFVAGRTGPG